jgi:hypothetical protein
VNRAAASWRALCGLSSSTDPTMATREQALRDANRR